VASRWREATKRSSEFATRRLREQWIADRARRQHGVLSLDQLRYAGLADSTVRSRVGAGRLFRREVVSTHPPPFNTRELWMAAVLAGGPGTLLSDWPAVELQQIAPPDRPPSPTNHVTVPGSGGRTRSQGLIFHRRGPIDPRDGGNVDGVPVTAAHLTHRPSLAAGRRHGAGAGAHRRRVPQDPQSQPARGARRGTEGAARHRPPQHPARPPSRPGALGQGALPHPSLPQCRLPRPAFNHPVEVPGRARPLTVELAWPDIRLAFELDTQRFHGDWERAEEDRDRDQLLGLVEWQCSRFFRRQIEERLDEVAERARRLYELRRDALA
jgi:hypothetical protein